MIRRALGIMASITGKVGAGAVASRVSIDSVASAVVQTVRWRANWLCASVPGERSSRTLAIRLTILNNTAAAI